MEWCEKENVDVVKLIHLREMLSLAKENNKKQKRKKTNKGKKKQKKTKAPQAKEFGYFLSQFS